MQRLYTELIEYNHKDDLLALISNISDNVYFGITLQEPGEIVKFRIVLY